MAIAISSIGAKVSFAFETTAGTRPTTGYVKLPQIKEIPEMNPSPETLETTSLDNTEYKTYIDGLKDLGGSLAFTANFTQELYDLYNGENGIIKQWENAKKPDSNGKSKAMYLCIDINGLKESCYLSVIPSKLGIPAASVNSVMEVSLYFTPAGEPEWDTDPEYAE
jgi:hypothetical protein